MPDSTQTSQKPTFSMPSRRGLLVGAIIFVSLLILFLFTKRGASDVLVIGFIAFFSCLLAYVSSVIFSSSSTQSEPASTGSKNQFGSMLSGGKNGQTGIFEAVSDGIVTIDDKGVIRMLNKAASYLAGWEQKDALNIDHRSVLKLCDDKGNLRRFVNFYVNSEDIRFLDGANTILNDGDEVSIIPAIAGG